MPKALKVLLKRVFLVLMLCSIGMNHALAAVHPNMFLNSEEISAIKAKIGAGTPPWSSAYVNAISNADKALGQSVLSVTFGGKNTCGGIHYYCTESPSDANQPDRADYSAAVAVGKAVRDLGIGYAFSGRAEYADKAIALIHAWALSPDTYMEPTLTNGQSHIEIFITLPGMFYGADLIWNYPGWNLTEKAAFKQWANSFGYNVKNKNTNQNNFANWKNVFVSSAGALTDDTTLLNYAFDEYRRLIITQIGSNGAMVDEVDRVNAGLSYSLYAINAMTQTAEIAEHYGVDLYSYKLQSGRGLEMALDYYAPYALNPSAWPKPQHPLDKNSNMALFELAYSYFQKTEYLDVINKWGRPLTETRVMGVSTLTHGNSFELALVPTSPFISQQPTHASVDEGGGVFLE